MPQAEEEEFNVIFHVNTQLQRPYLCKYAGSYKNDNRIPSSLFQLMHFTTL
jgi:hypothetical protein